MSTSTKPTLKPNEVRLKRGRLSWPHLFIPKAGKANDNGKAKKKYSFSLIFDKETDKAQRTELSNAIRAAASAKWPNHHVTFNGKTISGNEGQKPIVLKGIPIRDGAERADKEGYDSTKWFINASEDGEDADGNIIPGPAVIDGHGNDLDKHNKLIFGGCYAHAKVRVWCQDNDFGKRVNLGYTGVMYAGKGEPFGNSGPSDAKEDFKDLIEEEKFDDDTPPAKPAEVDEDDDL